MDLNPHDLEYWLTLGHTSLPIPITDFEQTFSVDSAFTSSGPVQGKVVVGDLTATLPGPQELMGPLGAMRQLAQGTVVAMARVEICRPGEVLVPRGRPGEEWRLGNCFLRVDMASVLVTGVAVEQAAAGEGATVSLAPSVVRVTSGAGTAEEASAGYSVTQQAFSTSGTSSPTATKDSPYLTTLTGPERRGVIATDGWSQEMSTSGAAQPGQPPAGGKPSFSAVTAQTHAGPGTVALLGALFGNTVLPGVEITGCETVGCTQSVLLDKALVTEVVIGSPTLVDQAKFTFAGIRWTRSGPGEQGATRTMTFGWDVANNRPI